MKVKFHRTQMLVSTEIAAVILPVMNFLRLGVSRSSLVPAEKNAMYPAVTLVFVGCLLATKGPANFPAATTSSKLTNAAKIMTQAVNVPTLRMHVALA